MSVDFLNNQKNAIVYSYYNRQKDIKDNRCYKQLRYSIDSLRKFNQNIPVYIYISPMSIDTSSLDFGKNTNIVKFDLVGDDGGWPEDWVRLGYLELLKHRWENAIASVHSYGLDNILYLDTDTIFHNDAILLFNKYGSTRHLWAKPDNWYDLMPKIGVGNGMNDGQFMLSRQLATNEILNHIKFYVNDVLSKNKSKITEKEYLIVSWVSVQYGVWDYFNVTNNPVKYFDEYESMISNEVDYKNTDNLILHHYFSGNTSKYVPEQYLL